MNEDKEVIEEYDNKSLLEALDGLDDDENHKGAISKDNSSKKIFITVIIILLIAGGIYYYNEYFTFDIGTYFNNSKEENVYSYDEDDDNVFKNYEYEPYNDLDDIERFEIQKNNIIVVNEYLNFDKKLILEIKNQNENSVSEFIVYTVFYNNENKIVGVDSNDVELLSTNESCYLKYNKTPNEYTRYETYIYKEYYYSFDNENIKDKIEFSYQKVDNEIIIKAIDKSEEEYVTVGFSVLYYDETDNLLDIENIRGYFDRKDSEIICVSGGIFDNETEKYVDYSKYEVVLNYAY